MNQQPIQSDAATVSAASSLDDPRLLAAMERYLELIEQGNAPDRDRYVERYPEISTQLNICLEGLQFVSQGQPPLLADEQRDGLIEPLATLGDYRILKEIGRGGMGVVYCAEQLSLGRTVAIKVFPFAGLLDQRQLARFKNERAAAMLSHPGIVDVHGVGNERSIHFYAMEFIDGDDLAKVITEVHHRSKGLEDLSNDNQEAVAADAETLPVAELTTQRNGSRGEFYRSVARLGVQAARALHFAHEQGIVHRDIKPANLLLGNDGKLRLTDFGLAQIRSQNDLTLTGDMLGTLRYMSPEQVNGGPIVDHRTDIYSLGLTLYELATGQPAFPGDSRERLVKSITGEDPFPLSKLAPHIPLDLRTIIEKASSKEIVDRYKDSKELADDLDRFLTSRTITARPTTSLTRVSRFARRNPAISVLLASTTLLCAIVAAGASAVAWNFFREAELQSALVHERDLRLYARDLKIAGSAIADGNFVEGERLLLNWVPQNVEDDLRGLEWYHLRRACHPTDIDRTIAHRMPVYNVAFSPDGTKLADAYFSSDVPIWNLDKPIDTSPEHKLPCKGAEVFTAETFATETFGNLLVLGDGTGHVYVWDWQKLEQVFEPFKVNSGPTNATVWSVDIDANGKFLAIGATRSTDASSYVEVYSLADHERVLSKTDRTDRPYVAFDTNANLVVVSRGDERAETFDVLTGELIGVEVMQGKPTISTISSDRTMIALGMRRELGEHEEAWVEIRDLNDWSQRFRFHLPGVKARSVAFSHDGKRLAVGDYSGTLWDADLASKEVVRRKMHDQRITSVKYSPNNSFVVTTGMDKFIHLLPSDWPTHQHNVSVVRLRNAQAGSVWGSAFLDNDRVATSRQNRFVEIWNPSTGEHINRLEFDPGDGNIVLLDAHRGERNLLAATCVKWPYDRANHKMLVGRVTVWDTDTGDKTGAYDVPGGVCCLGIRFSPDGRYLAVSSPVGVTVIDTVEGSQRQIPFESWVKTFDFSPDGKTLACAESDGNAHFLDVTTLEPVREPFVIDSELPESIGYIPGTNHLAVVGFENRLQVFDVTSGQLIRQSDPYPTFLATLRVSPDGSRIGVGAVDGKFRFFRTEDCEELISFDVPTTFCFSDFSPDGQSIVVSTGGDSFVVRGTGAKQLQMLSVTELREITCKNISFLGGREGR